MMVSPERFVPPEFRRVGMVFQNYALFPHLNVAAKLPMDCTVPIKTIRYLLCYSWLD
ncbi:MAG: hypothetical protein CM1200mP6_04290 [Anaerolineaceae bacterium]|nr:MAG: hypothetical protein CM1200mP6_04290 [Anaerolineaceae bacterium]